MRDNKAKVSCFEAQMGESKRKQMKPKELASQDAKCNIFWVEEADMEAESLVVHQMVDMWHEWMRCC